MRKTDKFDFFIAMGYIRGISFPEAWQQLGIRQKSSNIWIKKDFRRKKMIEFKYDTQLLIEGKDLDEDKINDYFTENFKGDCLLAVGDEELIKIHFHTNEPWKVLEYCASLGEIYDIVVEDMDRQARGLQG